MKLFSKDITLQSNVNHPDLDAVFLKTQKGEYKIIFNPNNLSPKVFKALAKSIIRSFTLDERAKLSEIQDIIIKAIYAHKE